jgi:hypothetical protein
MSSKKITVLATALVAAALAAAPALAITNGEPDGDRHPSVGALVAELPGFGPVPLCSGTLVSPSVFLTAAHCTAWLPAAGIDRVWVSFDSRLEPAGWTLVPGTYVTHPRFGRDLADAHDLAVVLLAHPVGSIQPASLPAAGLLDGLAPRGGLRGQEFTSVGYGYHERVTGSGPPQFLYDGLRRVASSPFAGLAPTSLGLLTRGGGVCYGDSGGPQFLGDSSLLVALTSRGDAACAGIGWSYRLDTPSARAFLGQFVALP